MARFPDVNFPPPSRSLEQAIKKGEGVSVRTEATNYKSIGLTLALRQLTIKRIILEKVIQVCFLLFYCNTEPLQGFLRRFAEVQTIAS